MKHNLLPQGILALALLASPAIVDAQTKNTQGRDQQKQQANQADLRRIDGEIVSVTRSQPKGQDEEHLLAKVRLDNKQGSDKTVVLDLGPVSDLQEQQAEPKEGQRISATGRSGRVNDRAALFVYGFELDPQYVVVADRAQNNRNQRNSQNQGNGSADQDSVRRQVVIDHGKIEALRNVKLKGVPERHRLIKISQGGQETVVNVGPGKAADSLNLAKGDEVLVQGIPGTIDNTRVIFASHIAQVAQVDWKALQNQQQNQKRGQNQNQ